MNIINKYFHNLTDLQKQQYEHLEELYKSWNAAINVISRKDIDNLEERHILHSLSIAKIIYFADDTNIIDVGTGGGLPGIPLAIMFPKVNFLLVDSIGKKIKVAQSIADELKLDNVTAVKSRIEDICGEFDFAVSRGMTTFPEFMRLIDGKISHNNKNSLPNGVIYLKGGDYQKELNQIDNNYRIFEISNFFDEEFFTTKEIVWIKA